AARTTASCRQASGARTMARITRPAPPSGRLWHLAVAAAALILGGAADRIDFPAETPAVQTQSFKKQATPQPPPSIATPVLGQAQAATPAEPQAERKTKAPSPSRTRDDARATA